MALIRRDDSFADSSIRWAIYTDHDVQVNYEGKLYTPDELCTIFPNQKTSLTHSVDSHYFGDDDDDAQRATHKRPSGLTRMIQKFELAKKSSSVNVVCHHFRYPDFESEKSASRICCITLDITIPPPFQPTHGVHGYITKFENMLKGLSSVKFIKIFLRVHADQPFSPDPTLGHFEYIFGFFHRLRLTIGSLSGGTLRFLNITLIQTRSRYTRKVSIEGRIPLPQPPGALLSPHVEIPVFSVHDTLGIFTPTGLGLRVTLRDANVSINATGTGVPILDSQGEPVSYDIGRVSYRSHGRVIVDAGRVPTPRRDSVNSLLMSGLRKRRVQVMPNGDLYDAYDVPLRSCGTIHRGFGDNNGQHDPARARVLRVGSGGGVTDVGGHTLVSCFAQREHGGYRDPFNIQRDCY